MPLPPLSEQRSIAKRLGEQMAQVATARAAAELRRDDVRALPAALVGDSLRQDNTQSVRLANALEHITHGVGDDWRHRELVGATRAGAAPPKAKIGKHPERYKPVDGDTVFYNPMRIVEQSIAIGSSDGSSSMTSPDYVVVKGKSGVLKSRWFYYWLRSTDGLRFIQGNIQGAVRPRLKWQTLSDAVMDVPSWQEQSRIDTALAECETLESMALHDIEAIDRIPPALLREVFGD